MPLRDGDTDKDDDEVYAGHFYVNAKSNTCPGIVDKTKPLSWMRTIYIAAFGLSCQ